MKYIALLIFITYLQPGIAQVDYGETEEDPAFKSIIKSKPTKAPTFGFLEAGYAQTQLLGHTLHGFQTSISIVLGDYFMTGIYYHTASSPDLRLARPLPVPVINPRYNYFFLGLNNGIMLFPRSVINVSIPIRLGWGGVTLKERYLNCFECGNGQIDQDYFFLLEPGIDLHFNLLQNLSFGGGISYRIAQGVERAGTNNDFNQMYFNAGIRFKFF